MAALGKINLLKRIEEKDPSRRLTVTPLLTKEQVGPSSIDVRLGNEFIEVRKTRLAQIGLSQREVIRQLLPQYQSRVRISYGKKFVFHPHQLILGSTFEYLKLPNNLMCYVIGRSSWGRLGLVIATATSVAPGFRGSLTLEIFNSGEIPLEIYPGMRIAQLVFHETREAEPYRGKHACATGPEFSRIFEDEDLDFWTQFG